MWRLPWVAATQRHHAGNGLVRLQGDSSCHKARWWILWHEWDSTVLQFYYLSFLTVAVKQNPCLTPSYVFRRKRSYMEHMLNAHFDNKAMLILTLFILPTSWFCSSFFFLSSVSRSNILICKALSLDDIFSTSSETCNFH